MRPQPRMQNKTSIRDSHHGHTGTTRHSPRNGFTAYFALSSVTTLFDTVAGASYRRLDANDWGVGTTRLRRPRQHVSSSALTASTASRPALMTLRNAPQRGRDQIAILLILPSRQGEFRKIRNLVRCCGMAGDDAAGPALSPPGQRRHAFDLDQHRRV